MAKFRFEFEFSQKELRAIEAVVNTEITNAVASRDTVEKYVKTIIKDHLDSDTAMFNNLYETMEALRYEMENAKTEDEKEFYRASLAYLESEDKDPDALMKMLMEYENKHGSPPEGIMRIVMKAFSSMPTENKLNVLSRTQDMLDEERRQREKPYDDFIDETEKIFGRLEKKGYKDPIDLLKDLQRLAELADLITDADDPDDEMREVSASIKKRTDDLSNIIDMKNMSDIIARKLRESLKDGNVDEINVTIRRVEDGNSDISDMDVMSADPNKLGIVIPNVYEGTIAELSKIMAERYLETGEIPQFDKLKEGMPNDIIKVLRREFAFAVQDMQKKNNGR